MKFRGVEGGTPTGNPLCRTCSYAHYIKGKGEGQELLYCQRLADYIAAKPLPFEAYECSEYEDKRLPSLHNMKQTAWLIQSDALTKRIGFIPPTDKKARQAVLEEMDI